MRMARTRLRSEPRRLEGITACNLPRLQPGHEPARALFRRAMGEGIRDHIALGLPLQPIVADGGRGLHGRLDIAGLDEAPLFLSVVRLTPGQAVGLQLDPHLELIALGLVHAALQLLNRGRIPSRSLGFCRTSPNDANAQAANACTETHHYCEIDNSAVSSLLTAAATLPSPVTSSENSARRAGNNSPLRSNCRPSPRPGPAQCSAHSSSARSANPYAARRDRHCCSVTTASVGT
jgi:hypothetical protein